MTANEKDTKIAELEESLLRAKRVLSVSRQGRSRSESNLKSSTDLISSLKEQIGKMETQITDLKQEKLKANTKVRRMSSKLGMLQSAGRNNSKPDTEAMKDAEDKQKRIDVQNKTIAGLASQNSKLRSELAKAKKDAEKDKEKQSCTECSNRDSQIAQLKQANASEKKVALSSQSKLERCKKKAAALEKQIADLRAEQEKRDADANCASATDTVQQELADLREKNESLILAMKRMESDKTYDAVKMLRAENFQLRKENDRLLKVDHLKLFEEIENLKYKYNEAVGKLNSRTW
jgi:phage shock protein A